MTDQPIDVVDAEPPEADATINLRDTAKGIDIEVMAQAGRELNPAVHFAGWVGRNLQALLLLSREDYNVKVADTNKAKRVMTPTPRLMGPNGTPLQ